MTPAVAGRKGAASVVEPAPSSLGMRSSTRKRKVNAELKGRGEAFLSVANPEGDWDSEGGARKKRKVSGTRVGNGGKTASNTTAAGRRKCVVAKGSKGRGFDDDGLEGGIRDEEVVTKMPGLPKSSDQKQAAKETTTATKKAVTKKASPEKRLRVFRKAPPQSYLQKLERATSQRMVVLKRKRIDEAAFPSEEIELVGSTGNVYRVTVGLEPKCTCPDYLKGNQCKHIVYALVTVLKAPASLQYQLAFLSSELREIFAHAPAIPTEIETASDTSGKRKPVDGECPICYMDFDEEQNELVWCKASCGNNMHKSCFDQWVASQRGSTVRCVYCRAPWQAAGDGDISTVAEQGVLGSDGYVNVAHLTGQSTVRDVSTYHPFWVRRQYRSRYDDGYDREEWYE